MDIYNTCQTIYGDCLEKMKDIPDQSVNMVLTDPHYGTTACKWDKIIPFEPMWKELKRIIKPKGAILLFGSEPFSSLLRVSNLDWFKYDWIWLKTRPQGFAHAKNKPMNSHEIISVFSPAPIAHKILSNKRMEYYPQGIAKVDKIIKNSTSKLTKGSQSGFGKRPSLREDYYQEYMNYPISTITFQQDDHNRFHPTQKPVALLEYLIKTYTLEGETVLDFTMGSGSTGVAYINLNRRFIGIEKDSNYFEIAEKRIEESKNKQNIFGI